MGKEMEKQGRTFPEKDKDMAEGKDPGKSKQQDQIKDREIPEMGPGEEREAPPRDQDQSGRMERTPKNENLNVR